MMAGSLRPNGLYGATQQNGHCFIFLKQKYRLARFVARICSGISRRIGVAELSFALLHRVPPTTTQHSNIP
jgi:hypothetical protein